MIFVGNLNLAIHPATNLQGVCGNALDGKRLRPMSEYVDYS